MTEEEPKEEEPKEEEPKEESQISEIVEQENLFIKQALLTEEGRMNFLEKCKSYFLNCLAINKNVSWGEFKQYLSS